MGSLVPAFVGMLTLALLPQTGLLWVRWAMYQLTTFGTLPSLLVWTLLPSNVAGRTKKSVTATLLFIAYCVGNAIGAQVMQAKDAPRYIPGITVCASMYGTEFALMGCWRAYCKFWHTG
jgi:ACS family allantoate permease-like MFS transporter